MTELRIVTKPAQSKLPPDSQAAASEGAV